jgi:hypothetical protein
MRKAIASYTNTGDRPKIKVLHGVTGRAHRVVESLFIGCKGRAVTDRFGIHDRLQFGRAAEIVIGRISRCNPKTDFLFPASTMDK